jgi:ribose 5-phosphate isomerase B
MRITLGCDHAGFLLKVEVAALLKALGHQVHDVGAHNLDPNDDYPDYAEPVAQAVSSGSAERGLLICGSGVGASIVANKVRGVRAAMCHDTYSARQGVEHDDMNVLCLGSRVIGGSLAQELITAFLGARFTGEERHVRRLNKVIAIDSGSPTDGRRAGAA